MTARQVMILSPGGTAAKGGMGRLVETMVRRLRADADLQIEVVDTYGPDVNLPGSKLRMPLYFAAATFKLLRACILRRIGLAHIHMAANGSTYRKCVLLAVCRLFSIPAIIHIHGGDLDKFCARSALGRRLLRAAFRQVSEVVVLGDFWRSFVVRELGVDTARVNVLPNAIPAPPAPALRGGPDECRLAFLGYVTPEKGVDDLLTSLSCTALKRRPWRLTIAGAGEIARYRNRAAELGIAERIAFTGWIDEAAVSRLLQQSDVLVLPSHFECLPMSIIEAMAHGLPVIATRVGAVPDAVIDGETGLLVPVASPDDLALALQRLVDSPDERRRLGSRARQRFEAKFDLETFHARIRAIYLSHLDGPRLRATALGKG
jgi:glycosyltransferase involved in cell wall biosynthesis